jgi:hypothetical protein
VPVLSKVKLNFYSNSMKVVSMTSVFCHKVDENCSLLGFYAASNGTFLLIFWDSLTVPSSGVENPILDSQYESS